MITTFVVFDVRNFLTQVRRFLPVVVGMILIAAVNAPTLSVLAGEVTVGLISSTTFLTDERGRLDTLYSTLPITRTTVVVGRYLTVLVLYIAAAVTGSIAAVIASGVRHLPFSLDQLGTMNLVGFLVLIFVFSTQAPFFFAWGYTRARLMAFLPTAIVFVPLLVLFQTGNLTLRSFSAFSTALSGNPTATATVAILCAIAASLISASIARVLYVRRQL